MSSSNPSPIRHEDQSTGRITEGRAYEKSATPAASPAIAPSVLILGSAPSALLCQSWSADWLRARFSHVVAVNNAWRLRPDWDVAIYPEDFPPERRPAVIGAGQQEVEADAYVPANNAFGGVFYAGGTMAFTAGYWALHALRPARMAFLGCDMMYPPSGQTHFYGTGTPDPLRVDPSLRSLEAKSARLWLHAAEAGCAVTRLSEGPSRLIFPTDLHATEAGDAIQSGGVRSRFDATGFARAKSREAELGYVVPSGRYWEAATGFDLAQIDALDSLWTAAFESSQTAG